MKSIKLSTIIIYTILFGISLSVLLPILHLVAMSFSDPLKVHELTGLGILPKGFSIINYKVLFSNPLIVRSIMNTIFITVVGTLLNLFMTAIAAYVLSRTNFVGKRFVIVFLIVIMVFEPGLIPEYLLIK